MHLADLHLGAPLSHLGAKAAERSRDLESALFRALEAAPEKGVHAVLVAGDTFDSYDPPPDLVERVRAAFKKTSDGGIPIILIPGTHDSHRYSRSVYKRVEFPGVEILMNHQAPIRKNLNGCDVYFHGFSGGRDKAGDASNFRRGPEQGIHVALVHGPVLEAEHWDSSPRDYALTPKEIETSGFDYIALGHHHNFREFKSDGTIAVYPGTLEGLKFGEEGERYLVVAELAEEAGGVRVTIEKSPHNARSLVKIDMDMATSAIGSTEGFYSAIKKKADPDAIARITISGATDFPLDAREAVARIAPMFFHVEIVDRTSMVGGGLINSIKREETVRGIFVRKMLDRIENCQAEERATAELALRLGIEQFIRTSDEDNQNID
jgi:DNA repair exonuclease SbcCD nuclease subunit